MKTCLKRFLGECKRCRVDYDPNHHPNNLDCPWYEEIELLVINFEEKGVKDASKQSSQKA